MSLNLIQHRLIYCISLSILLLLFLGCNNQHSNQAQEKTKKISSDKSSYAFMKFDNDTYDFGTINDGDTVNHVFKFSNTGKTPLLIENVSTSCGCTVAEYTRSAIPPGGSGNVSVSFNKRHDPGFHTKSVIIKANTEDPYTVLHISATVKKAT